MRTKTLSANQRIRIGKREHCSHEELSTMAHVMKSVGLTLEIEREVGSKHIILYAARRPVTHDVAKPSPVAKPETQPA